MTYLKFYRKERELYSQSFQILLTQQDAKNLTRKLVKHFTHEQIGVYFTTNRRGLCDRFTGYIKYPKKELVLLGIVLHESAHAIEIRLRKNVKHDKRLMKRIGQLERYVITKKLLKQR